MNKILKKFVVGFIFLQILWKNYLKNVLWLQTWNYTNKITLVYNERSIKILEYDSTMVVSFKCLQTISKFVEGFESICRNDGQLSLAWSLFWILLVIGIGKHQSSFTGISFKMLWNVQWFQIENQQSPIYRVTPLKWDKL